MPEIKHNYTEPDYVKFVIKSLEARVACLEAKVKDLKRETVKIAEFKICNEGKRKGG